jgi:hypothetical protein
MCRLLYVLLICLFAQSVRGQHLSFDELIKLRSQDVGTVNAYLEAKNWKLKSSTPETDKKLATIIWDFGRTSTSKATAFLTFQTASGFEPKIRYQASKKSYDLFLEQIHARKMKQVSSNAGEGHIWTVFSDSDFLIEMIVGMDTDGSSAYIIALEKK